MAGTVNRNAVRMAMMACLAMMAALLPLVEAGAQDRYTSTWHLSGADNAAAAIAFSEFAFPGGADEALLGRDDDFPDALASGVLQDGRPLLLTPKDSLGEDTEAELERLGAETVHILGGTAAVSESVETALEAAGYTVVRHSGPTRIETAIEIAKAFSDTSDTVIIARAFGDGDDPSRAFADSLAAGAWAAESGQPVLLSGSESLTGSTAAFLTEREVTDAFLVGGTAALSPAVEADLEELGIAVTRVAGATRFETAVAVAEQRMSSVPDHVVLVEGQDDQAWAAGFASAAYAAANGAPVLLSNGDDLPTETSDYLEGNDDTALVCAPSVTESACDAASELLGQLAAGQVSLASDTVAQMDDLEGTVAPDDNVSSVLVSGCGLSDAEVTLGTDGAFAVRITGPEGECELVFSVTHTDDRVIEARREITVTELVQATSRPELRSVEPAELTARVATVRFTFSSSLRATWFMDTETFFDPETGQGTWDSFVLYGLRTTATEERFAPKREGSSDDGFSVNIRRDPDDLRSALVDFDRTEYEKATTGAVAEQAAQNLDGQHNAEGSAPLKALELEPGQTNGINLVSIGNFTTDDAPQGRLRARFTFDDVTDLRAFSDYVLVLPDGRVVPGQSAGGGGTTTHTVQFDPTDATEPGGSQCSENDCPSVSDALQARRGYVKATAEVPLQSVAIASDGATSGPDLDDVTFDVDGDNPSVVRFGFDENITGSPVASAFHLFDAEGASVSGSTATVSGGKVDVTFPTGSVHVQLVGAWVDDGAAQSSTRKSAGASIGITQSVDAGTVFGPKLTESRIILLESNPDGTSNTWGVDYVFDGEVALVGQGEFRVYRTDGAPPTAPLACAVDADDKTWVTCEFTDTDTEEPPFALATVRHGAVETAEPGAGNVRYPNVEGAAHL